ncbi:MAG: DUF502 domain-containing protein, partial [Deltaproteobacteria bacterium]|nr:DUF502 domain-containing protein [Deltaproteobacteria bacterium]
MTDPAARTFNGDFRRFFLRGLVVLLPTVLTLWIVVKAYQFIDTAIAEPINRGLRTTVATAPMVTDPLPTWLEPEAATVDIELAKLPPDKRTTRARNLIRSEMLATEIQAWWKAHWYMDLIGLFVAIIVVYIAGRLLGGFFGRQIYRRVETLITSVPIFKQVYPYVKQIVDFLFSDDQPIKFNRVVVVEYPRKGIWSVGFLTGDTLR